MAFGIIESEARIDMRAAPGVVAQVEERGPLAVVRLQDQARIFQALR